MELKEMKRLLSNLLRQVADNLDAGNSNIDEEGCMKVVLSLDLMINGDLLMSKPEAFDYLNVSRATFDTLVSNGFIPKGKQIYQGTKSLFWYKSELDDYLNKYHQNR